MTTAQKEVLEAVRQIHREVDGEIKTAWIRERVDKDPSTVSDLLTDLVQAGHLRRLRKGWYDLSGDSQDVEPENLQRVPEIEVGAGEDVVTPVNGGLKLPKTWIRQSYGVTPDRLCVMRVRGDSMRETLPPGQRLMAARWGGEDLEDGVIYGLRGELGFTVKRLRFDRKDGEKVIWVWSDNPDYEVHRHYVTRSEFGQEYDVVARALEVGQKL